MKALKLGLAFILTSIGVAHASPQQLRGKVVVVRWQEAREQRMPGDNQFRPVSASGEVGVSINDAGRTSTRLSFTVQDPRANRARSGGKSGLTGARVSFAGDTMTVGIPRGAGSAIHLSVKFDGSFSGCSARGVSGMTGGTSSSRMPSIVDGGGSADIRSVRISGESCSIQN
jgi:hypothetical protein